MTLLIIIIIVSISLVSKIIIIGIKNYYHWYQKLLSLVSNIIIIGIKNYYLTKNDEIFKNLCQYHWYQKLLSLVSKLLSCKNDEIFKNLFRTITQNINKNKT